MTDPSASRAPADVVALAEARQDARAARDFTEADALRDRIGDAGWVVADTADGFTLVPSPPYDVLTDVSALPDRSAASEIPSRP